MIRVTIKYLGNSDENEGPPAGMPVSYQVNLDSEALTELIQTADRLQEESEGRA